MASPTQPGAWPGGKTGCVPEPTGLGRRETSDGRTGVTPRHDGGDDLASRGEIRLVWDPSVEAVPLARGWDAEPCIVDWCGTGQAALLVSSGGGPRGRSAWLYRPLGAPEHGSPPCYDAGVRVPELDGLRCLCPIPNDRPSRFDLVAIDDDGLVGLPNSGTSNGTGLRPQGRPGAGSGPGDRRTRGSSR